MQHSFRVDHRSIEGMDGCLPGCALVVLLVVPGLLMLQSWLRMEARRQRGKRED